MNKVWTSMIGGLAGALATTVLHEGLRQVLPDPPRLDKLGEEALDKGVQAITGTSLSEEQLYPASMAADILSNAIYYSAAGGSKHPVLSGLALGLVAGSGAVQLPGSLGLDAETTSGSPSRKWVTIGLYTFGGVVAGLVIQKLSGDGSSDV